MKYIFIISLLLLPAQCRCQQDTILLSPRVGSIIDADERAYFGLFPDVDGFSECIIRHCDTSSNQYDFVLFTTDTEDSIITRTVPDSVFALLGRFIRRFEAYSYYLNENPYFNYAATRHTLLRNYGLIKIYSFNDEFTVTANLKPLHSPDAVIAGTVLYSDSQYLLLGTIDSGRVISDTMLLWDDIQSIHYHDGGAFWRAFGIWSVSTYLPLSLLSIFSTPKEDRARDETIVPTVLVGFLIPAILTGGIAGLVNHLIKYNTTRDCRFDPGEREDTVELLHERQYFIQGIPPEVKQKYAVLGTVHCID